MCLDRLVPSTVKLALSGGPALEIDTAVGEVCAIAVDRFPFACFSCLEEITDESDVRLSEELGI